ncbi:VC0807 family protein [Actinacidiphila paucisporea]|uniref:DUF3159 domain-containing protein n=1 Tax=Actinacidiphila paucisporea TaxID=310782 RepID=A0A1M7EV73_9ACTN|nr:VC0807 family protein [Actinacidiphila paucisporea]SHL95684.1 hypothetical protein SAMN05216499_10799 [Actinacidiphila paucisporea]
MTDAHTHNRTEGGGASSPAQSVLLSWGPTVLFGMLLPWITYHQLIGRDVHGAPALMLVSAWPALEIGLYFALHQRVDEIGMLILVALLLATVTAAAGCGSHWMGVGMGTAFTGLVGVAFAVSPVFGRPLTFWLGRRLATDGSAAGTARWNGLWLRDRGFRAVQCQLSAAWAVGFLLEAGLMAMLPPQLPVSAVGAASLAGPVGVTAALVGYSARAGKAWAAAVQTPAAPSSAPTA